MDSIQQTPARGCRFLDDSYFEELYRAFLRGFSDYVMPFDLTEVQFRNHVVLNAVEIASSAGWFEDGKLVGFTLNGFGTWLGKPTVYDAGTGIFPEYRRRGISTEMFAMMLPEFRRRGYQQYLLEVITDNYKAIGLYEKLGFETTRTLSLLEFNGKLLGREMPAGIELRDIEEPDWRELTTFWDGKPSWQNTTEAMDRSRAKKRIIGAFSGRRCVGYIIFSANVGRVAQLAVDPKYRRQGIASMLLYAMAAETETGLPLQVLNIDRSIDEAMQFFKSHGFSEKLRQHEMLLEI
jgi:ribosomal protein S18 acetylase RimI-like enzyme